MTNGITVPLPTHVIHLSDLRQLTDIVLPSPHFGCLIAADSTSCSTEELASAAEVLIGAGCVYFCCWGPGCERFHDIIDGVAVHEDLERGTERTIMTTWHSKESLPDAVWFLLTCSSPDDEFEDSYHQLLAISVDSPVWAREIEVSLTRYASHA